MNHFSVNTGQSIAFIVSFDAVQYIHFMYRFGFSSWLTNTVDQPTGKTGGAPFGQYIPAVPGQAAHSDSQTLVTSLFSLTQSVVLSGTIPAAKRTAFRFPFFLFPVIRWLRYLIRSGVPKTTAHRPQSGVLQQPSQRRQRQASRSLDDSRLITLM